MTLSVKDICEQARASAQGSLHAASSFTATADIPEPASLPSVQPPVAAEPVLPPPATEKKYRLPSRQKMPAAHQYKCAAERAAERREVAGERGAEPVGAAPPLQHNQLFLMYHKRLLDDMVPPPLVKLRKRLRSLAKLWSCWEQCPQLRGPTLFTRCQEEACR